MFRTPFLTLVLISIISQVADAQSNGPNIPDSLSFQGRLTENTGTPVPDGNYDLLFTLYKGSTPVWQQNHPAVPVSNGVFHTILGGSGGASLDTVAFNVPIELGITVNGGDEMLPRTPLTGSAYAMGVRGFSSVNSQEGSDMAPNIIAGASINSIDSGVVGATINGGGGYNSSIDVRNSISGKWGTIGGGADNNIVGFGPSNFGSWATIAGGRSNYARGGNATIGGGGLNEAIGGYTTVPGGLKNAATGTRSFAAGAYAKARHARSFVWSDALSESDSVFTSADGQFLIRSSGGVGINTNTTPQDLNIDDGDEDNDVLARFHKSATNADMVVGLAGSDFGMVSVQSANSLVLRTDQTERLRITSLGNIGIGESLPNAKLHVVRASSTSTPQVQIESPGGMSTDFARLRMKTQSDFYWDIASGAVANDQLNFFTSSGRGNVISLRSTGTPLVAYNGATLTTGGVWTNASSRTVKTDIEPLDGQEVLEKLSTLPIMKWRYRVEETDVRHYGPMAEDFRDTFGLGDSDAVIATADADGVALAAIQSLYEQIQELRKLIVEQVAETERDHVAQGQ